MSAWNGSNFYRFVAKVLVFFMVIQGMPLWELSRAYEWEFQPQKLQRVLDAVLSVFSPNKAYAGVAPNPDDYTINQIPGNFVDISDTGTQLTIADDGAVTGIPVGFNFEFFSTIFTSVTVTDNGSLTFATLTDPNNSPIPMPDTPNAFVAPFWDDLNPNTQCGIFYSTVGSEPERKFIVEWKDVPLSSDPDSRLTFEVILFEGTNEIQFHYFSMIDGSGMTTFGPITGASATIGIENSDGTKGNEIAFNKDGAVTGGSAFSFTLAGNAFETGRDLGDLNGDGGVNILDHSVLTDFIIETGQVRTSLELVVSDVAPVPSPDGGPFGDRVIDSSDHDRIFEALMDREDLNPTLALPSCFIATTSETLTIYGSGFDPGAAANNIVVFVGVDGTETQVPAESVTPDGNELSVTIPSGLEYISSVRVEAIGLLSNSLLFLLQGVPLITSLSQDFGEEGDTVLIRGYEFGLTPGDNLVTFNGVAATVKSVINSNGIDILYVTVPDGITSGPLLVNVASQPSNEVAFLYDGPPVVAINSPEEDGEVSGLVEVTGTASDLRLVNYTLEYAPLDGDFTAIVTSTDSVENDVLGTFDTTLLVNGFYELRLTAEDESGKVSSIAQNVLVSGNNKPGINTITFTDLQVPVSGIDITIQRKYDSRVKTKKDFGVGWSIEILDVELRENMTPGSSWYMVNTGGLFYPNWELRSNRTHMVVVTFPDGKTDVFDVEAKFDDPFYRTGNSAYATFAPRSGTTSTLALLDNNFLTYQGGDLFYTGTYRLFNPSLYLLTTKDGRELEINQSTGLESIEDTNGNAIYINDNGIVHSSGKSIFFIRDAEERISQIIDPMNNALTYTYDANGNLVSFTDRVNNTVTYTYDDKHNLIELTDPRGVTPLRCEYDENGRLIATRDANGNRIELTHDLDNYTSVVRDRLGNATVYEYNERGDVLRQVDALGNVTTYTYDTRGNLLTQTDPLGNATTNTYDASDNLLTRTDALGNTRVYTYNARGQILTTTDPLGHSTTNSYDANGNLLTATNALGETTTNTYDASGNILSTSDCLGNTTTYEYDTHSNLISQTDALGNKTTYTYDANGNQLTETTTCTDELGNPVTITTTNIYDAMNRLVQTIDPDGNTSLTEYDAIDNQSARVDKNGNRTEYEYDLMGNLITTTYPDGTTETSSYDANGNTVISTDRAGRIKTFEYDALNRPVRTIFPDGSSTRTEYDAAGRVVATIDENGNGNYNEYDAAGRTIRATDALGNVTMFAYDANANQISQTDANGNTTTYEYDAVNRQTKSVFPDGNATSVEYSGCGRRTAETDQAGNTKRFEYNAVGRLTKVIDALGAETTYAYDEVGNKINQTDSNGNTTTFAHDKLGRLIKKTLPLGMFEVMTYDAEGNMISKTDFNGDTITYTYDVNSRLINKSYPDSTQVSHTYTATGQREAVTDARGITSYSYDVRDRLIRVINPDGSMLTYTYDAGGNRTSVTVPSGTTTYAHIALNRLETATDPDGGVTTYTYDSVGNRIGVTLPNGTVTVYTYDTLNRLTYMENKKSTGEIISSYTYTLGPAGNRTKVEENTGGSVNYTYDNLYRLIEENINDPVLGNETISYTYDLVGNRFTRTDSGGVTTYTYDANDRLLIEATPTNTNIYTYDNNGNTVIRSDGTTITNYAYDYENRLITSQTGTSQTAYEYDADGIRVRSTTDGAETNYLADKNRDYAQVLEERDGIGSLIVNYVFGDDLISQNRSGELSYYHYDGLGSTRAMTTDVEGISNTYIYDAFGSLMAMTGDRENDYLFAGEQRDSGLDAYYLRSRYYSPAVGRFFTMDNAKGFESNPKSLHKYTYGENDPVNNVDPTGQFVGSICEALMVVTTINVILAVAKPSHARSNRMWLRFKAPVLTLYEGRFKSVRSKPREKYFAVSGLTLNYRKKLGPIPPGDWFIKIFSGGTAKCTKKSPNGNCDTKLRPGHGIQGIPKGRVTRDWGFFRARIYPRKGTKTFGRKNFYLHSADLSLSGYGFATLGCISTTSVDVLHAIGKYSLRTKAQRIYLQVIR